MSASLIVFGIMAIVFAAALASRADGRLRQSADSAATATFFAGLMLVVPLSMSLIRRSEVSTRSSCRSARR